MGEVAKRQTGRDIARAKRKELDKDVIPKKGGYYFAGGEKTPDAWKTQEKANDKKLRTEVIVAEQTYDYAKAIVRAYSPNGWYVDDAVIHHFKTIQDLTAWDYYKKDLEAVNEHKDPQYFEDIENPFDNEGRPNMTQAGRLALLNKMMRFKNFAVRDAISKAERRAQLKVMNKEWREEDEVMNELDEVRQVAGQYTVTPKDINGVAPDPIAKIEGGVDEATREAIEAMDAKKKAQMKPQSHIMDIAPDKRKETDEKVVGASPGSRSAGQMINDTLAEDAKNEVKNAKPAPSDTKLEDGQTLEEAAKEIQEELKGDGSIPMREYDKDGEMTKDFNDPKAVDDDKKAEPAPEINWKLARVEPVIDSICRDLEANGIELNPDNVMEKAQVLIGEQLIIPEAMDAIRKACGLEKD